MNGLIRRGQYLAYEQGWQISPSKVSRIVRRHLKAGATDVDIIRNLRAYRDPVGDEAVYKVTYPEKWARKNPDLVEQKRTAPTVLQHQSRP